MIVAKLEDAARYRGICPSLDMALERFAKDLPGLEPGETHEIDGRNLWLNCFDYETVPESQSVYEAHDLYGDIHILLKGEEKVMIASPKTLTVTEEKKPGADIYFLSGEAEQTLILRPGTFLVVFPDDAHKLKMHVNGASSVRKAVYKFKL